MSKSNQINWKSRKRLKKALKREIKNFNARLDRALKAHPENAALLPKRKYLSEEIKKLTNETDLRREREKMKRFTAETAQVVSNEFGVQSTIFEIKETEKAINRENKRRAKEREKQQKKKVYSGGKEIVGAQKAENDLRLQPINKKFKDIETQSNWKNFTEFFENLTEKKKGEYDPTVWHENISKALISVGITDDMILMMYTAIGYDMLYERNAGHNAPDLDFLYDLDIDYDDKINEIRLDLAKIIQDKNLEDKLMQSVEYAATPEVVEIWQKIGYKKVFDLYKKSYENEKLSIDIFNAEDLKNNM